MIGAGAGGGVVLFRLRRKNTPTAMAAMTAMPPTTPPTIAPIGALAGEDVSVGVGLALVLALVLDDEVELDVVELNDVVFAATDTEIATGVMVRFPPSVALTK